MKTLLQNALLFFTASILTACSYIPSFTSHEAPATTSSSTVPATESAAATAGLVGSTVNQRTGEEENVVVNMAGGASIATDSMNAADKTKMSQALDAGLGKSSKWTNASSGVSYTVTPVRKVVIKQNPFCREYHVVIVSNGNRQESKGTACVMTDGGWHRVSAE